MERVAWIALGGALGAVMRHGCTSIGVRWVAAGIPLGVLIVNVIGSFAAGFVATLLAARPQSSENLRAFALVGLLGAFTTFSAFSNESVELLRSGAVGRASLHALLHLSLSIAAAWLGLSAAR